MVHQGSRQKQIQAELGVITFVKMTKRCPSSLLAQAEVLIEALKGNLHGRLCRAPYKMSKKTLAAITGLTINQIDYRLAYYAKYQAGRHLTPMQQAAEVRLKIMDIACDEQQLKRMATLSLTQRAKLLNTEFNLKGPNTIKTHHLRQHFNLRGIKYKQINVVTAYRRRPNPMADLRDK